MEERGFGFLVQRLSTRWVWSLGILLLLGTAQVQADFTLNVTDTNNGAVASYKWVLEEDTTFAVTAKQQTMDSLANSFQGSYAPVVMSGESLDGLAVTVPTDPTKRYYISVTAFGNIPGTPAGPGGNPPSVPGIDGYAISGESIDAAPAAPTAVTVQVEALPLPVALISVLVFRDKFKVNGVADLPQEDPVNDTTFDPTQFTIQVYEAGGRYGISGGLVSQDAFGNVLGTTYNPDGSVLTPGSGVGTLVPDAAGKLTIYNLSPGKYGIQVVPPPGQNWQQTSTIEGTKTIDAWVLANEAPHFTEFGPPGPHVFIGFVQPTDKYADGTLPGGTNVISGTVVNNHMSRPPAVAFYKGNDFPVCWVALQPIGFISESEYIQPCDANSAFNIAGVPDGSYEIVVFDNNLNVLIATKIVTVGGIAPPNSGALGKLAVFNWFSRFEATVYNDLNGNALRDPGESPIQEQAINIRFRDGSVYQSFPTDASGEVPFDEVFPFFHWLVAEVDFTTLKATGVTYVVDAGGGIGDPTTGNGIVPIDNGWAMPSRGVLNPQVQENFNLKTGNYLSTTIEGPVLTMGMQALMGQTNIIEFGKQAYLPGENGGISGIVYYAVTRAEDDPELAAAEPWEPGIPRIPVTLYRDGGAGIGIPDGVIDDNVNDVPGLQLADVDHYPFDWITAGVRGPEDIDQDDPNQLVPNAVYDYGDAMQVSTSDSWDDNLPTNCVSSDFPNVPFVDHPGTPIQKTTDCYDGLRMFNQVREAVFDGGYAFSTAFVRDLTGALVLDVTSGLPTETASLVAGGYIVQSYPPTGYKTLKEEDRNVDFGNSFTPATPLQLPAKCVGAPHLVPAYFSFQTDSTGTPLAGIPAPDAPFFANQTRPLCDTKQVFLTDGKNAAADFYMFTDVPISAHVTGLALDDLSNEFDPINPNFGEKLGMKWIPVVFRDWTGRAIAKVYTDEYGRYNALVPSTYTVNIVSPSGVQPNMMQACINDGTPDPVTLQVDAAYRSNYSTTCYAMQFMPGTTSYLDTPVVPIAAFAGPNQFPVDCELPTREPEIAKVEGPVPVISGPYVPGVTTVAPNLPTADAARTIVITSTGMINVPNPEFTGLPGSPSTVARDYGFGGTQGTAMLGTTPLTIVSWSDATITAVIPLETPTGELTVTRSNGMSSRLGVTVTTTVQNVISVTPSGNLSGGDIQAAINGAPEGSLILIAPGEYFEMVIVDRPLKLQGWGARSTIINALRLPSQKLIDWRTDVRAIIEAVTPPRVVSLVPGQQINLAAGPAEAYAFQSDESPVILVMADSAGTWGTSNADSRIDGLTLKSADQGGAVLVNGYAHNLTISNNRIAGNQGNFGGGIRFGNALYTSAPYVDVNRDVSVHHNHIVNNGGFGGSGGGISIHAGTNNYAITENFICGNFTSGNGAGIGHQGLSTNGLIADNMVVFNQSFNQGLNPDGGGIFIAGTAVNTGLGLGSGSVSILRNQIEGNHAGAGYGGGIRLANINGADIFPGNVYNPARILIENNMIVGNVAGNAGGGIAMKDAVNIDVTNNTIAHNMSTATTGNNFQLGTPTQSVLEKGAGIVSFLHSAAVQGELNTALAAGTAAAAQTFSDPALVNNILWQNRSYLWVSNTGNNVPGLEPSAVPLYSDLAVQGTADILNPMNGILTDATGYDVSNTTGDPLFIRGFGNGNRDVTFDLVEQTIPNTAPALDEGGNFIDVRYGPLSLIRNYHILTNSPAVDSAAANANIDDIDGLATRPVGLGIDKGADEISALGDTDGDGITDDVDNCTLAANTDQRDTDGDGFGNMCDADLNNDGMITLPDYSIFRARFGSTDPDADFNGDGLVNLSDYSIFRASFGNLPGPSAIAP